MKRIILLFSALIVLCLFVACEKKESYALRSARTQAIYDENNKIAAKRLHSVMFNLKDSLNPVERLKIVHISDAHISSYSNSNYFTKPNNLIEAIKFSNQQELGISAIVATGDHINYAQQKDAIKFLNSFYTFLFDNNRIPTFPCHGNHDGNMKEKDKKEALLKTELYTAFNNKNNYKLQREEGENYYYADIRNPMGGKVRIIALDMLDQSDFEYNTVHNAVFSQKQVDWFCNKALKENMTEQHHVIVITHFPFETLSKTAKNYLIDGKFIHSSQMIPEIIEAFRDKKEIKSIYNNQLKEGDIISVNADFTASAGDFICYMAGHAHFTTQSEITNVRNKSESLPLQKILLATNMAPSEAGVIFNRVKREKDTETDNSFCIYAIDTRERNIYITFFGAYLPSDKSKAEYPEVQVISY